MLFLKNATNLMDWKEIRLTRDITHIHKQDIIHYAIFDEKRETVP